MLHWRWFPDHIEGSSVVLRRHSRDNLRDFMRWYQDPEVARLTRYQDGPMRAEEIERFFTMRALGTDSLAMGIHVRETNKLIGSCAFSQLDGDNGSALYHITIGEKDAWGQGYGTEATRLMLDHAFGTLGLHRIALFVFEFNERAIRTYKRCGFVVEGRSRESIFRDGQWWDEIAMSVLESDWRRQRIDDAESAVERAQLDADMLASDASQAGEGAVPAGSSSTRLLRRTMRRLR